MPGSIIIGVAGGTGSGKTALVSNLVDALGSDQVAVIQHDSYYLDQSHLTTTQRLHINYDHPDTLESSLLVIHLRALAKGDPIEVPIYDFSDHVRLRQTRRVEAHKVVIVEGILIFVEPELRDMLDIRIFVQTDDDVRFIRRLRRDMAERGRSMESVIEQYLTSVKPMHLEFVEPSKRYADLIIPEGAHNLVAIDVVLAKVKSLIDGFSTVATRLTSAG